MAACVLALAATGDTVIHGWDSVATSYPGFAATVDRQALGLNLTAGPRRRGSADRRRCLDS